MDVRSGKGRGKLYYKTDRCNKGDVDDVGMK